MVIMYAKNRTGQYMSSIHYAVDLTRGCLICVNITSRYLEDLSAVARPPGSFLYRMVSGGRDRDPLG